MISKSEQQDYWASIDERRTPAHPAVVAFAAPKVDFLSSQIDAADERLSLLEVGCGNGFFSVHLADRFDITCLDFSANMLSKNPMAQDNCCVGDVESLPFPDDAFDVVFCANLLHHLEAPEVAVAQMTRVARRFVLLVEPNALNPLMFLFCLAKQAEHGALKFTPAYFRRLAAAGDGDLRLARQQGSIVPNATPPVLLPLLKWFDGFWPFGFYSLGVIALPTP